MVGSFVQLAGVIFAGLVFNVVLSTNFQITDLARSVSNFEATAVFVILIAAGVILCAITTFNMGKAFFIVASVFQMLLLIMWAVLWFAGAGALFSGPFRGFSAGLFVADIIFFGAHFTLNKKALPLISVIVMLLFSFAVNIFFGLFFLPGASNPSALLTDPRLDSYMDIYLLLNLGYFGVRALDWFFISLIGGEGGKAKKGRFKIGEEKKKKEESDFDAGFDSFIDTDSGSGQDDFDDFDIDF